MGSVVNAGAFLAPTPSWLNPPLPHAWTCPVRSTQTEWQETRRAQGRNPRTLKTVELVKMLRDLPRRRLYRAEACWDASTAGICAVAQPGRWTLPSPPAEEARRLASDVTPCRLCLRELTQLTAKIAAATPAGALAPISPGKADDARRFRRRVGCCSCFSCFSRDARRIGKATQERLGWRTARGAPGGC